MKRCYFTGMREIFDVELIDRLFDECEKIINAEDQVEFWFFHGEHDSYTASCLCLATRLRTIFPEKVKIVRVFDPVKDDEPSDWYSEAYNIRFPRCLPDRNVFAPVMDEGVAKIEMAFAQQANKVERWIFRQMDVVFAYYYPNLEDSIISQVEFAQKSCKADVIHICYEETEKFIQEKAETMFDERTTTILAMLKDNVPQKEIGKTVGVTTSRIGQIAHKAARDIRHELLRRGVRVKKDKERKCALCSLGSSANALQLVVFESLLSYLSETYQIKEFWIDEKSCNTAYGAVLAKFCAHMSSYAPSAKVVVSVNEDEPETWDRCIKEYVPPYFSVVNLCLESEEWSSICEDMIRQCSCVISDFTSPDAAVVHEICAKSNDKYLFDIPRSKYEIDEQY